MAEAHRKNQRRPHVGIEDRTPFPEVQSGPCGRLSHLKIVEKPMKTRWNVQCIIMLIWEYPTYGSLVWLYMLFWDEPTFSVCIKSYETWGKTLSLCLFKTEKTHSKTVPANIVPYPKMHCISFSNQQTISVQLRLHTIHVSPSQYQLFPNPSEPQPQPRYRMPSIEQMMSSLSICVQVQLDHSNPT